MSKNIYSIQMWRIQLTISIIVAIGKVILIIFQIEYIMSITATETQQLQLVNIISITQTKLSRNFSILHKRLNQHDLLFDQNMKSLQNVNSKVFEKIQAFQAQSNKQISQITEQIKLLVSQVKNLNQSKIIHQQKIKKNEQTIKRNGDELFNTQLQFQQKNQALSTNLAQAKLHIGSLFKDIQKLTDQINTKESKVQVQRVIKQIQRLKQEDAHFQASIKLNEHKIQKIQILNQKAERLQAKKDIEFMKEIQEKVKRQVKAATKSGSAFGQNTTNNTTNITNITNLPENIIQSKQNSQHQSAQDNGRISIKKRLPFSLQEDQYALTQIMKNNIDHPLSKMSQKIKKIEVQMKDVNEVIRQSKLSKREDKTSPQGIKDKINQLKPEVIKLWAKFDTLQDRLAFNQKKMQQKNKILNEVMQLQKQNNWQKMQEKVKTLQTQIYSNIKDIKAKLDTKVNISDYQKFVGANDDKIIQINELIYLKSDKLQVKKALLFLQSKIKQIILVISEDQENQKDALLTKKPIKCISCDKEVDKFSGISSGQKGNWDNMPYKQHAPQVLGRFGMTNFGSLAKKLKRLQGKDLPLLNKKNGNNSP